MELYPFLCNFAFRKNIIIRYSPKMKRLFSNIILLALLGVSVIFIGCRDRAKGELNKLLLEIADADETIDATDWEKLVTFFDAQKANFKSFFEDEELDVEEVKEYIEDFFEHRRPAKKIRFEGIGTARVLHVNFYLERSGSMTPYDSPQGDGSFKAAIVQMLNNLPGENDEHNIYVVNSTVNEYPQGFSKFLTDNNIFEATKGIGDPSFTDFGAIFKELLDKTDGSHLSILVTDMIYSTKDMAGVNPQKVFSEAQGMTNAVFKSQVKDKAMLIVKMNASYNGPYYSYNSTAGKQYDGRRPYYIVIVGTNDNIARLTRDESYSAFAKFSEMKGYEDMYLFETDDVYHPYYSLLLSGDDIRGRFRPTRGQDNRILSLEDIDLDKNSGDLRLALAVDLSGMLIDKQYLTNAANYIIESDDPVEIKQIREIEQRDLTPAEKKYIGTATHIFVLEMKQIKHDQEIEIKLRNELPTWIEASSSDDDSNLAVAGFSNTTFALKYLLQGIYNSYKRYSDGTPYYFEMELKLKK